MGWPIKLGLKKPTLLDLDGRRWSVWGTEKVQIQSRQHFRCLYRSFSWLILDFYSLEFVPPIRIPIKLEEIFSGVLCVSTVRTFEHSRWSANPSERPLYKLVICLLSTVGNGCFCKTSLCKLSISRPQRLALLGEENYIDRWLSVKNSIGFRRWKTISRHEALQVLRDKKKTLSSLIWKLQLNIICDRRN